MARAKRTPPGDPPSKQRIDSALNRLFTEDLRLDEAQPLIDELRPIAADLVPSLVNLLNSPDRKTRTTASALLSTFEKREAVPLLRRLIDSTGASDAAKLSAYSVLQTLGVALEPESFIGALRDPETLFQAGLEDILQILRSDAELSQFLETLDSMPKEGRLGLIRELGDRADPDALKLFTASLWYTDAEVVAAAVEQLRRLRDPRAVESLLDFAGITRRAALADAARQAALELRIRSSAAGERRAAARTHRPAAEDVECHASFIDGDGGQMLIVLEPTAPRRFRLASFFLSDHRGLADCFGTEGATRRDVNEMLQGMEGEELGWARVGREYCRARVVETKEVNRRSHRRLPAEFEIWKDALGEEPDEEAAVVLPEAVLPDEERAARLARTGRLLDAAGFQSWLLPGADLAPFLPGLLAAIGKPRRLRQSALNEAVSACIRLAFQKRQCRIWRSRLERQAFLWHQRETETALTCLAAAWGMSEKSGVPLEDHPLLRAMVLASFEVALGMAME
jgi:HEAT repeat protein